MMKRVAEQGSVSHGTMCSDHLIPRFMDVLRELDADRADQIELDYPIFFGNEDETPTSMSREEMADYLIDELFDALDAYAPEGCYFGAHPGDGADYGYWPYEE